MHHETSTLLLERSPKPKPSTQQQHMGIIILNVFYSLCPCSSWWPWMPWRVSGSCTQTSNQTTSCWSTWRISHSGWSWLTLAAPWWRPKSSWGWRSSRGATSEFILHSICLATLFSLPWNASTDFSSVAHVFPSQGSRDHSGASILRGCRCVGGRLHTGVPVPGSTPVLHSMQISNGIYHLTKWIFIYFAYS